MNAVELAVRNILGMIEAEREAFSSVEYAGGPRNAFGELLALDIIEQRIREAYRIPPSPHPSSRWRGDEGGG